MNAPRQPARERVIIPEMSVADWIPQARAGWRQGEHVALIGPTGRGKTTLARKLLPARSYVCVLAVKRYDDTLDSFKRPLREGKAIIDQPYKVIKRWPPDYNARRVILWSKPRDLGDLGAQQRDIYQALGSIYHAGGWTVFFDDATYIAENLRLEGPMKTILNQGRSSGISAVIASTRPRRVPLAAWNQARLVVAFRYNDDGETERIAEIAGVRARDAVAAMHDLGNHDFLAWRDGEAVIVRQ